MADFKLEPGELIMGVGNGGGNLFVKGDYDSITVLQQKLLELEELRKIKTELLKEIDEKNIEITRLGLEVASLRSTQLMPNKPGFTPCPDVNPCIPKPYKGQDIIWCTASSMDIDKIQAKSF